MLPAPILYHVSPQSNFSATKMNFMRNTPNSAAHSKPKSNSFSSSRDSEWLTLEVCREFLRGTCPRNDLTCRYAHPSRNIYCNDGRVVCCYDYIKGRCYRNQPPCKYLHPPIHLKEQLLQNGKANLLMKTMQVAIPKNKTNSAISRANSTGSYQFSSLPLSPRGYPQSQLLDNTQMSSIHSMSYISPLPYFLLTTRDNHNHLHNVIRPNSAIESASPNPSSLNNKSLTTFNYPMASSLLTNDSILANQFPAPQYYFGNMFGHGNQLIVNNWPLCTYSTVPY